jgi:predicted transcriptional regulator
MKSIIETDELQIERTVRIIRAMANLERIEIVKMLLDDINLSQLQIQERMHLPKATIAKHLHILKTFGLVSKERHEFSSTYTADGEKLAKIADISEYLYRNK